MTGISITVTAAAPADFAEMIALAGTLALDRPPNDAARDLSAIHRAGGGLFCARDDGGQLLGMVAAPYDGRRGWIAYLGVTPAQRQTGLAARLMEAARQFLVAAGASKIVLLVRSSDAALIGYYAAHGFAVEDVTVMGRTAAKPFTEAV